MTVTGYGSGWTVATVGTNSGGLVAQSIGGGGGNGGFAGTLALSGGSGAGIALGGSGAGGGNAGSVAINSGFGRPNAANIFTAGGSSVGILAQSIGGGGGNGGFAGSLTGAGGGAGAISLSLGGRGGYGGTGAQASANSVGNITTLGNLSHGALVQSIGGGGGNGGFSVALGGNSTGAANSIAVGGNGGAGANAGSASLTSQGNISTAGQQAHALIAQSIGGGGGNGGFAGSGVLASGSQTSSIALGGSGAGGGSGAAVSLQSIGNVTTSGSQSSGLVAQSVGGGGGNGGWSVGLALSTSGNASVSLGGGGADGGSGGAVSVTSTGNVVTGAGSPAGALGSNAFGVLAQSIGGGGGNGGFASSFSGSGIVGISVAIGGTGGGGGSADSVNVTTTGAISTTFDISSAILAQSIGGGGGNGGFSVAVAGAGRGNSVGQAIGGTGGAGGAGGLVNVTATGTLVTEGAFSHGIDAQSVGGGGGNGGFAIAGAITVDSKSPTGGAQGNAVGGAGGSGNRAGAVTVIYHSGAAPDSGIATSGAGSVGIFAQSIGGGGGAGGYAVTGTFASGNGSTEATSNAVGGAGGLGNDGGAVSVTATGNIQVAGANAAGILAQSVGGGGGVGGFAIAANFAIGKGKGEKNKVGGTSDPTGGAGGDGGRGGTVVVASTGNIVTQNAFSYGILGQSVGGGGGSGGFAIGAGMSSGDTTSNAVGGTGGTGGTASGVTVTSNGNLSTAGAGAVAVFAQSVGGGGGSGGFAIAGGFSKGGSATSNSVGGNGGVGGNAGNVQLSSLAAGSTIMTTGSNAVGLLAQSVGGGGGNGGFAIGATVTLGDADNTSDAIGGTGGAGGRGGNVEVTNVSGISTGGLLSHGIFAQSVGGGGGSGGFAVSGSLAIGGTATSSAVGGAGGACDVGNPGWNDAGTVSVNNSGAISVSNAGTVGIFAQSVGGGGGSGGFAGGLSFASDDAAVASAVGGSGSGGGDGKAVSVTNAGVVTAAGSRGIGILAQSIGGGGGSGGFSIVGALGRAESESQAIGGQGGTAGQGGSVTVTNTSAGAITTSGALAYGIFAQSVGGGGGNGGFATSGGIGLKGDSSSTVGGGAGGAAGDGGIVTVGNAGSVATVGSGSIGVLAQSIGGGGGAGGFSGSLSVAGDGAGVSNSIGGQGAGGGLGEAVTVTNDGVVQTDGANSIGILAQSIGGGGGTGGYSLSASGGSSDGAASNVGGAGAGGGAGGEVIVVNNNTVLTRQVLSTGILAQSIGGGGGNGGFAVAGAFNSGSGSIASSVGGAGGAGGAGGTVRVTNAGNVVVMGPNSVGILAQSVGGGGGNGGFNGILVTNARMDNNVGGAGGAGGNGGDVVVTSTGSIMTLGANSAAVIAQSIGGGGGNGAFSLEAGDNSAMGSGLTVGGSISGGGGDGVRGTVTVNITGNGTTQTARELSYGLLAQSIGGGGGSGGLVVPDPLFVGAGGLVVSVGGSGAVVGHATAQSTSNSNVVLTTGVGSIGLVSQSIGGGGGVNGATGDIGVMADTVLAAKVGGTSSGGGSGSSATLGTTAAISTTGDNAIGALTQSIGGGGGVGSFSLFIVTGTAKAISVAVGGSSGGVAAGPPISSVGNDGAAASLTASGQVATQGVFGHGLVGQSIGGGGGVSGFVGNKGIQATDGVSMTVGGLTSATATPAAGGQGGAALVVAAGAVTTGAGANAIVTQSIGGGGGLAGFFSGNGSGPALTTVSLGSTSGSGKGASSSTTSNGAISVSGAGAVGILAQSIGGGGGVAQSVGATASGTQLTLGASGGASGNGGAVVIYNNGAIGTFAAGAHAIVAQSIGGGGGFFTATDGAGTLQPVAISAGAGGGGGSGAGVTVTNTQAVTTRGFGASGIIAQSIGGGGGLVGGGSFTSSLPGSSPFAGSVGSAGNASDVRVTSSGVIQAIGAQAFGIFAQSAAGSGAGGLVTVEVSANVLATGAGSTAILAESSGAAGGQNVSVTIAANTTVSGGNGAGAAIAIRGIRDNTIENAGTITTQIGAQGYAVRSTSGANRITNAGLIAGSVVLGGGSNAFQNRAGAVFDAGAVVDLGHGNHLTNEGLLSPGGYNYVETTSLTGNLTQTASAVYGVDLDMRSVTSDRLEVSGSVNMSGVVRVNLLDPLNTVAGAKPGQHETTILVSQGGLSVSGVTLEAPATAVSQYELGYPGNDSIVLRHAINYAPAGLTGNQLTLGNIINAIQSAQMSPAFAPIANALFFQPNAAALAAAYDSLSGSATSGAQQMAFAAGTNIVSAMRGQAGAWLAGNRIDPTGAFVTAGTETATAALPSGASLLGGPVAGRSSAEEPSKTANGQGRWHLWATSFAKSAKLSGDDVASTASSSQKGAGVMSGADLQVSKNLLVGFAGGGGNFGFTARERATSGEAVAVNMAAYGAYRSGGFYVTGMLGLSVIENESRRQVAVPVGNQALAGGAVQVPGLFEDLKGRYHSVMASGDLEAGYKLSFGTLDVTPFAGVQFATLLTESYNETLRDSSASSFGLSYARRVTHSLPTYLGLRLETKRWLSDEMRFSAWMQAAWRHEWSTDRSSRSAFLAAPGFDFTVQSAIPASNSIRASLGLDLRVDESISMFTSFEGDVSRTGQEYSGTAGFRIRW